MSSAADVVVLLATVWVSSIVAIAPCSDVILAGLSTHPECYPDGHPPSQQSMDEKTVLISPTGLIPQNVVCVTACQGSDQANVTLHFQGDITRQLTYAQTFQENYVEETDSEGIKYRLYVIRNEKTVYAYYRCLENGVGTGIQSVHVAIGCKNVDNAESLKVVDTVKMCFQQLNLTSYVTLQPCNC